MKMAIAASSVTTEEDRNYVDKRKGLDYKNERTKGGDGNSRLVPRSGRTNPSLR